MNYAYLFVDNLNRHSYENGLKELQASILSLKKYQNYDSIQVFNNEVFGRNIEYFKEENINHNYINLSRNYGSSNEINPINILVEKIISLMNYDETQDIVLMDIDTTLKRTIPENFWDHNNVIFDNAEYYIMQWRNLDKVLPQIPWKQFDINFDSSFIMYNTGVIYIPKRFRKELCEKALSIVDYLNQNFDPKERLGNKLDEQIALSIVCHDCFGKYGNIKLSNSYIDHHWEEKQKNVRWWEKYACQSQKSRYDNFIQMHYQNCLNLVNENANILTNKVIIDIGSNIGLFSKCVAENISYSQIHLFEPSTEYLNKSKDLLKNFSNITYNNFALSDVEETKTLYKSKESNIGWNTLYEKDPLQSEIFLEKMEQENIKTVKLDDYYKDIKNIDFIKIDVEGFERNVLEGSWNLIKKFKPHILIEVSWGVNHPEWLKNKKTYEKLFSLGYERIDLDSITHTCDVLFKPKNRVTLVTGLWDAGRDNLDGIWNRSFTFYMERFLELLKTDNNLIIFGDNNLKKIVFENRSQENTQFILRDLSDFKNNDYYPLIQKIRNDPKWKYQNDWIKDCPLGAMEMAIPIYLSKMIFLNEAIQKSKFDSDYFYHVDGGTRMDKNNFSKEILNELTKYSDFFFISFPYIGKEIHGFDYEKAKELTLESVDDLDMVSRGTFFGGHKDKIETISYLYYDLMMKTLNDGFMGLDESIFTILTYKYPELIDYYKLNENDFGDPEVFFKEFKATQDKFKLFKKIKLKSAIQKDSTYTPHEFNKLPISVGILSWKSDQTLKNTLESYKNKGFFDIVDDVTLLFQEVCENDINIANEYKLPFIALSENSGIGNAFSLLANNAKNENILLLEHDWELIENKKLTFDRLNSGIELLNSGYNCIRYRHRKNPGFPLFGLVHKGEELNHFDPIIDLEGAHLFDSVHWVENPEKQFSDKIFKYQNHFITTSRWSNFTNNPCLYKKDFYMNAIEPFKDKGSLYDGLESNISYWWARQNFNIAWGEGLFKHNDIQKYGDTCLESLLS